MRYGLLPFDPVDDSECIHGNKSQCSDAPGPVTAAEDRDMKQKGRSIGYGRDFCIMTASGTGLFVHDALV